MIFVVYKTRTAQMHVRHEPKQGRVIWQSSARLDAKIGGAWWNQKVIVGELQRQDAPGRRVPGKNQADASAVRAGVAVGGVMHLKDEVGACGDELGHVFGPCVGRTPGRINQQFFFSSRRRHTRCSRDWSSDVCSSD